MEDKNKPAFPNLQERISKREYFALKIMQGLCAGRNKYEAPGADTELAIRLADKLLNELETTDSQPTN